MLSYKRRGDTISEADINQVFFGNNTGASEPRGGFTGKLYNLLGGKSFLLAFQNDGLNPLVPPQLLGKCVFFNDGKPTAYSQNVPGAIKYQANAIDPVTGLPVTGTGVRSYDHSYFATAAGAATVNEDEANNIRYIADVPQSAYPPGLQKLDAVSIFEHSLDTHEDDEGFFLGELQAANGTGGGYFPTKRYEHALVEFIIENLTELNIPAAQDRKYACVRAHNLSLLACTLTLSGHAVVIPPLGCVTIRRTWSQESHSWTSHWQGHYFFPFRATDICFFWHWPALPSFTNPPRRITTPVTAANGAQGNNVSNPAVLYDFVSALRWSPVTSNLAWWFLDVHELCDMGADFADYYPALKNTPDFPAEEKGQLRPDAKLFDLLVHIGRIDLKKVRAVAQADGNLITSETFQYRGLKTILADFAAAGITVTMHADGNLQFSRIEADHIWDLLPIGTNLFRWGIIVPDQFDSLWQRLPRTIELNAAKKLDPRILENGGLTNPFGTTNFTLRSSSDYRIAQRTVTSTARARQYLNSAGQLVTVQGTPQNSIALKLGPLKSITGVHEVSAIDYRDSLRYHGDAARGNQSDDSVTYTGQRWVFTPNGPVLIFTEQVRADIATWHTNSNTPNAYAYAPIAGMETNHVRYTYNAAIGKFEAKHCVRFRKHGVGFAEFGKQFAHHYSPAVGRCLGPDYTSVQKGPNGADASIIEQSTELPVKQARSLVVDELTYNSARFALPYAVDHWPEYATVGQSSYGESQFTGSGYAYKYRADNVGATGPLAWVPMTIEHLNSMLQLVNQLKTGRPLDYRCLRIVHGAVVLNFDLDNSQQALRPWETGFGSTPAPVQAFASLLPSETYYSHWSHWLSTQSIPVHSGNIGMPASLAQFQNQWNETRTAESTATARVENATHAGNRVVSVRGANYNYTVFNGRVTIELTDLRWSAPTQVQKGQAMITHGEPFLDLNTAYVNQRWISLDTFKAFCARIGLPFVPSGPFVPLVLDTYEMPSEFKRAPQVPSQPIHIYEGEIASCDGGGFGAPVPGPPRPEGITLAIAKLNTLTDTRTITRSLNQLTADNQGGPSNTKQIAFRLAGAGDTVEWKLPVPRATLTVPPPLIYWRDRERPEGGWRVNRFMFRHVGFIVNLQPQWGGARPAAITIEDVSPQIVGQAGFTYTRSAPWLPTGYFKAFPAGAGSIEGTDLAHTLANWEYGYVERLATTGPRIFWDWKAPTDAEALRRADNYFAALAGEKYWIAWQMTASVGLNVTQPINLIPEPLWGQENSWWLANQTEFLHSIFSPGPPDRPSDLGFGAPALVTAGPGITLVQPNAGQCAQRVLWDTTQMVVPL